MPEVNLLRALPQTKRNIEKRAAAQTPENIAISRQYGREYFDGPREVGYGGYRYDGRWLPVARDIVAHFGLKAGDRVLDVGCAKGFLGSRPDEGVPGPRSIRSRHFRIRADALSCPKSWDGCISAAPTSCHFPTAASAPSFRSTPSTISCAATP